MARALMKLRGDLGPDHVGGRYELKLISKLDAEVHLVKIRMTRWARQQMGRDVLVNLRRQLVVAISRTECCYVLAKHLFTLSLRTDLKLDHANDATGGLAPYDRDSNARPRFLSNNRGGSRSPHKINPRRTSAISASEVSASIERPRPARALTTLCACTQRVVTGWRLPGSIRRTTGRISAFSCARRDKCSQPDDRARW